MKRLSTAAKQGIAGLACLVLIGIGAWLAWGPLALVVVGGLVWIDITLEGLRKN